MPSPGWEKHHHIGSATIDPHWQARECLTIEGMSWISHLDFTTYPLKEWGLSLGLILLAMKALKEQMLEQFGHGLMDVSYFFYVFFLGKKYTGGISLL